MNEVYIKKIAPNKRGRQPGLSHRGQVAVYTDQKTRPLVGVGRKNIPTAALVIENEGRLMVA